MFLKLTTSGGDVIHSWVNQDSGPATHRAAEDKRILDKYINKVRNDEYEK